MKLTVTQIEATLSVGRCMFKIMDDFGWERKLESCELVKLLGRGNTSFNEKKVDITDR